MSTVALNSSSKPKKSLIEILKKHSGRDASGKVSVRHQGGRQKRYYRIIDFKRNKLDQKAIVESIEKDPNRGAFIALIKFEDGEYRYILAPNGLKLGDEVVSSDQVDIALGNSTILARIPVGIEIHNIELYPGQGGKLVRGAGTFATVVANEGGYAHIKMISGEVRKVSENCRATIGRVSNIGHKDRIIGKAGTKILMGVRPTVRGTAQNPRSHPHGGGEGRSGEGMHPKTPWGKPARGKRTRTKKKWSNALIVQRRKR